MSNSTKRVIRFTDGLAGNPSFHFQLSKDDRMNGIFVELRPAKNRDFVRVEICSRMLSYPVLLSAGHQKLDAIGQRELTYKPKTIRDLSALHIDFYSSWDGEISRLPKVTKSGEVVTPIHHGAIMLLAFAGLPVWAKDPTAYRERWPNSYAEFPFDSDAIDHAAQRRAA